MAISRQKKEQILEKLNTAFSNAKTASFMQNNGLTVEQITKLRRQLSQQNIELYVAKKTLLRKAAEENGVEGMDELSLEGPVAVAFSYDDEVAGPKAIHEFAKKSEEKAALIGATLQGKAVNETQAVELAKLPSYEQMMATFIGTLQAPISGFVQVNAGNIRNFMSILDQLSQKES